MSNQTNIKANMNKKTLKYFNYQYLKESKQSVENDEIDEIFGKVYERFLDTSWKLSDTAFL